MPPQLQALNEGSSILLDKPVLLLGRDLECDIRLDSRKISRRHCCIAQVGQQLVIRDLGSTNGVRINGVRVIEGHLKEGDELTIGNFRYRIRWDEGAADQDAAFVAAVKIDEKVSHRSPTDRPPNEDDLLEECDEPVPLVDPAGGDLPVPRGKAAGAEADGQPGARPPAKRQPRTALLPDHIELAPQSGIHPEPKAAPVQNDHLPPAPPFPEPSPKADSLNPNNSHHSL